MNETQAFFLPKTCFDTQTIVTNDVTARPVERKVKRLLSAVDTEVTQNFLHFRALKTITWTILLKGKLQIKTILQTLMPLLQGKSCTFWYWPIQIT